MKTRIWFRVTARLFILLSCMPASVLASESLKSCDSNVERLLACISQVWKEWPTTSDAIGAIFSAKFAILPNHTPTYFVLRAETVELDIRTTYSSLGGSGSPILSGFNLGLRPRFPPQHVCPDRATVLSVLGKPDYVMRSPAPKHSSNAEAREWASRSEPAYGYQYLFKRDNLERTVLQIMFQLGGECLLAVRIFSAA